MYATIEDFKPFVDDVNAFLEQDFITHMFDRFLDESNHALADGKKADGTKFAKFEIVDSLGLSTEAMCSLTNEFYYLHNNATTKG